MKTKKLIIVGIGETAELAYEYFTHDSEYEVIAFCVNSKYKNQDEFINLPVIVLEEIQNIFPPNEYFTFIAVASGHLNRDRIKVYNEVKKKGYICASYVSSKCFKWHNVKIGENCFILEDNTLQPFTTIENNVIMWSGNHLGHRSIIHDNCFVTSHVTISGFCEIGENSFLGVNSTIADNIKIAKNNLISMGAVVNKNTKEDGLYTGNPAKNMKVSAKEFCGVYRNE